ncbi:MAG: SDR family NAD(P)-dependent oxidoreductase [Solirubrobacterales bacterium]
MSSSNKPPKVPLAGRTAVITGAASGIGRAVAIRLAGMGCPLALADQNGEGLEETADLVAVPVTTRRIDVRDRGAMMAWAAEIAEWAPAPIGLVFNNAGVTAIQSIAEGSPEDDEWVTEINFGGVVNGVRAFLPILLAQDSGAIVNTSSVFGLVGIPNQSAYCASKFAVRGYTDSLRQELRETGVSAATVHPGGIKTNIVANARFHSDPRGRFETKDEMATNFTEIAQTTPERAAEVIVDGVERGRARILIGADARMFDFLARVAPSRYYDILDRGQTLIERAQERRRARG